MIKNLLVKFPRVVFFLIYFKRGASVNHLGSLISPLEMLINNSKKFAKRSKNLQNLLLPTILSKKELKRYGSLGDGGYVLPVKLVGASTFLIAGGIKNNNEFELELARIGIQGIQIDNSIDRPPVRHRNLTFIKATLGTNSDVDIDQILLEFDRKDSGILKLDIEGAEFDVLNSLKSLRRFNIITVEFHGLYKIYDDKFWSKFRSLLVRLKELFEVVYISPNNCCGYTVIGGVPIPNVLEVTFARKNLIKGQHFKRVNTISSSKMKPNKPNKPNLDASVLAPEYTL